MLGIEDVIWNSTGSRVKSAADGVEGFVLSRAAERNGRPVSFVFNAAAEFDDGQNLFLDEDLAKQSINYKMLAAGLAYPTYYKGIFPDLRDAFTAATEDARARGRELWSEDRTNEYFAVDGLSDVTNKHVILPKLFRRIVGHIKEVGSFSAPDFVRKLAERPEEVMLLDGSHFTHFDNLIQVNGDHRLKLRVAPEKMVFMG